jgi:hypothetical protein
MNGLPEGERQREGKRRMRKLNDWVAEDVAWVPQRPGGEYAMFLRQQEPQGLCSTCQDR